MNSGNNWNGREWAMMAPRPKNHRQKNTEQNNHPEDGSTSNSGETRRRKVRKSNTMKTPRGSGKGPTNPFLIFFLRMRSKKPNEPVTAIARKAGKTWAKMTPNARQKYVDLANAEKRRRDVRQRKKLPKIREPEQD